MVKNNDIKVNDRDRIILVHSKPSKSERVRNALLALSRTALDHIYFKSYRISNGSMSASSSRASLSISQLCTPNNEAVTPWDPMSPLNNKLAPIPTETSNLYLAKYQSHTGPLP